MPSQAVIKLISDINFLGRKNIGRFQRKWLNDVVENAGRKSNTNDLLSSTCVVLWPPPHGC